MCEIMYMCVIVRYVVYSIQHYVIKIVSDIRQVGGFLRVLRFPPPIKLTAMLYKFTLLEISCCSIAVCNPPTHLSPAKCRFVREHGESNTELVLGTLRK
jgi:hypothetical protein